MIQVQGVRHAYEEQTPIAFPDFELGKGEKMLLLGQSGCGKTTLLHILGGLLKPKEGTVLIDTVNVGQLQSAARDRFRGQNIGIIFQKPHFVRSLTVMDNLLLSQKLSKTPKDKKSIQRILDSLQIGHKANKNTQYLSQGEQQRVAIARSLVNQPKLILADEPTSALDDTNTKEVIHLLEQQAIENEATLIIVTHDTRLKDHFQKRIEL